MCDPFETVGVSTSGDDRRFLRAGAVAAVVGTLLTTVTPIAAGAAAAFTGSVVTSGLLGLVFAGRSLQLFERTGRVDPPAAVLTLVFGLWFMLAPLLYDVGFLATAGTQFGGLVVAAFAAHMSLSGLVGGAA